MTTKLLSGADFSPCRKYRYTLWRLWSNDFPPCLFVMLNPSTADEVDNDPTVERCERRARSMGYGGLLVANIFALRSTDPAALYACDDPVGPENNRHIVGLIRNAGVIVCAWGKHGALGGRGAFVRSMIEAAGRVPHALALNADGSPRHPLYVGYKHQPTPWEA